MTTYRIIRKGRPSADPDVKRIPDEVIRTGLSLDQAQAHCRSPYTRSGSYDSEPTWFDTYEEELTTDAFDPDGEQSFEDWLLND